MEAGVRGEAVSIIFIVDVFTTSRKRLPQFGWYKEGGFDCAHPIYHYIFKLIFLQFVQANIRTFDNSIKASENPHKLNAHTFLTSIKLLEIKNRQPRHCSTS